MLIAVPLISNLTRSVIRILLVKLIVQVEVTRTAKSVYRKIAECARSWSRHQTRLKYCGGSLASCTGRYVEDIWVNKEHTARGLE